MKRLFPKKLTYSRDEPLMPTYSCWQFTEGALCERTSSDLSGGRRVQPTDEQWRLFWQEIDEIGVWRWRHDYTNFGVLDGNSWSLELKFGQRSLNTGGCNGYPGGSDQPIGYSPESDFGRFEAAFQRLVSRNQSLR